MIGEVFNLDFERKWYLAMAQGRRECEGIGWIREYAQRSLVDLVAVPFVYLGRNLLVFRRDSV